MKHNYHTDIVTSEKKTIPTTLYTNLLGKDIQIATIPRNHPLQFKGADKLIKRNGNILKVEEKVRYSIEYADLLLETVSCVHTHSKGWIEKESIADYLVYGFYNAGVYYVYNFKELQAEYFTRKNEWLENHKLVYCQNPTYSTKNIAIPFTDIQSRVLKVVLN